jgi:hypothetical protein
VCRPFSPLIKKEKGENLFGFFILLFIFQRTCFQGGSSPSVCRNKKKFFFFIVELFLISSLKFHFISKLTKLSKFIFDSQKQQSKKSVLFFPPNHHQKGKKKKCRILVEILRCLLEVAATR